MNQPVITTAALWHDKPNGLICSLFFWCREICCLFLLSPGLHLRVSNWDHRFQWRCRRFQEDRLWGHRCLRWLALLPLRMVVTRLYVLQWLCGFTLANSSLFLFVSCSQRTNTPRKQGGLGAMKIPLVSDTRRTISTDYGVLKEDEGIAYRWV